MPKKQTRRHKVMQKLRIFSEVTKKLAKDSKKNSKISKKGDKK